MKAVIALACSKVALTGPPFLGRFSFLAENLNVNTPPYNRVSMFGVVAGERCVLELRGGAGGVPDSAEPGPGRVDGRVCAGADAPPWGDLRRGVSARAGRTHADICELYCAGRALRGADDCVHRGIAGRGQSEDGGAAGADGFDPGDGG